MASPLRFSGTPQLTSPSLVIGWSMDASKLGSRITDYLIRKLGGEAFGEIEPLEFFPLGGISIEDNLVQFPECIFYACPRNNLILLKSAPPGNEWHKFLNLVLDAVRDCQVKELFAIGAMVSLAAHTAARELRGTFNSAELRLALSPYNLAGGQDYETPPGQRPTLNSFLLWVAKQRGAPGASLWAPIPFYLLSDTDPKAEKRVLEFFNQKLELNLDFSDLNQEITSQSEKLNRMRDSLPEIDEAITKLEGNVALSEEESQRLAHDVGRFLKSQS